MPLRRQMPIAAWASARRVREPVMPRSAATDWTPQTLSRAVDDAAQLGLGGAEGDHLLSLAIVLH